MQRAAGSVAGVAVMRVLVVEDEQHLAAATARWLRRQGMLVDEAYDGRVALAKAEPPPMT